MARIKFAVASQLIVQLADLTNKQPEKFAARITVLQKIRDAWAADREVAFITNMSRRKDEPTSKQNPTNENTTVRRDPASECMRGSSRQELCTSRDLKHSAHRKDQQKLDISDIKVKDEPIMPLSNLQSSQRENVTFADSAAKGSDTGGDLSRKVLKRKIDPPDHIHTIEKPFPFSCRKAFRTSTSCRQQESTHQDNGAVPQASQATKERVSYPPVSDADSSLKLPAAKRQQGYQTARGSTTKAGPVSNEGLHRTPAGGSISYQKTRDEKKSHSCNVDEVAHAYEADLIVHVHQKNHPIQCKSCFISFPTRADLEHHTRTCGIVGNSSKAQAGTGRPTSALILKKYEQIHKTKKTHTSTSYKRAFPTLGVLQRHKQIHTNPKPHVCDVCNKSFKNASQLKVHKRTHTGEKPFKCSLCEKRFSQNSHLKTHWKKIHKLEILGCKYCRKTFLDPDKLRHHEQKYHRVMQRNPVQGDLVLDGRDGAANGSTKNVSTDDKTKNLSTAPPYLNHYACDVCEEIFPKLRGLQTHYKVHISKSQFRYERQTADAAFPVTSASQAHNESYYTNLNSNGSSATKTGMITQSADLVKGGKEHECQHCGKIFGHKGHLTVHERIHTGEKPFSCDVCQKTFSTNSSLNNHQLTQHGIVLKQPNPRAAHTATVGHSNDHPFPAKLQSAASSSETAVESSKKNAPSGTSVRKCSHCGQTFNHLGRWQEHNVRVHTRERSFCEICGRVFPTRSHAIEHMLNHLKN